MARTTRRWPDQVQEAGCTPLWIFAALAVSIGLWTVPTTAAEQGIDETRDWVIEHLLETLKEPPNTNKLVSLTFPLVNYYQQTHHAETGRVLGQAQTFLQSLDVSTLSCGELVDVYMGATFLASLGKDLETSELQKRLAECDRSLTSFDMASALFFYCRFTHQDPEQQVRGGITWLESIQRPDGGFGMPLGMPEYYLSSHAVFALYHCCGDPEVVRRGQEYLLSLLPLFEQMGFNDGLAESLVMLKRMNVSVPDAERLLSALQAKIRPDGGLCYMDYPGCLSDWHTTGLLLELQRTDLVGILRADTP